METSLKELDFLDSFDLLWSKSIDKYDKNQLNLFLLKINSNEFDYNLLVDTLLDPMVDYAISRKVKEKYKNKPATLSKKAREKFVDYTMNNGELGELLLFCFLNSFRCTKNFNKIRIENFNKSLCKWIRWRTFFKIEKWKLSADIWRIKNF